MELVNTVIDKVKKAGSLELALLHAQEDDDVTKKILGILLI